MIKWTTDISRSGWLQGYLHGDFKAQKVALALASGQPGNTRDGDGKVTVEFTGACDGQPFTLYDYKGDRAFHIGGTDKLDLVQLAKDLEAFGTVSSSRLLGS